MSVKIEKKESLCYTLYLHWTLFCVKGVRYGNDEKTISEEEIFVKERGVQPEVL